LSNNPILVGVKDLILEPKPDTPFLWEVLIPLHQRKPLEFLCSNTLLLKILALPPVHQGYHGIVDISHNR
jgi:hypothetical protein